MSMQDLQAIVDDMQEAAMALTRTYDGIPARATCPDCAGMEQVAVQTYQDAEGRTQEAPDDLWVCCPRCQGAGYVLRSDEVA